MRNNDELKLEGDKRESLMQWTNDPCGISGAKGLEIGSREFFEKIDKNRYDEYAPWLRNVVRFDQWAGKKVLEVGFGMGTDLFQFAKGGAQVSGVDLVPRHLEIARKRFEVMGGAGHLQLADAEKLPFSPETFDLVYTFGVVHHTPDIGLALAEIHRVLKKGGEAIIGVYHKNSVFYFCSVLAPYLLGGRFLRESFRKTLSRIEYREHGDACPLVKLFTHKSLLKSLNRFSDIRIECRHLERSHFGIFRFLIPEFLIKRLETLGGWYLIAKCRK